MHKLFNRKLLKFQGREAFTFLQGLVTSDMTKASCTEARPSLFLSSMGHILSEVFIFKKEEDYYVDTHKINMNRIINVVKRRKLAAKVEVSEVETELYTKLPKEVEELMGIKQVVKDLDEIKNEKENNWMKLLDVRSKKLGYRYYNFDNLKSVNDSPKGRDNGKEVGIYEKNLILNGCVLELLFMNEFSKNLSDEGSKQSESMLEELKLMPFDFNLDKFNYIDRNKGCYVGQEIVNRIVNKNLINKYILYLVINNNAYSNINNNSIINSNGDNLNELVLIKCLNRYLKRDGLWLAREWFRSELEYVRVDELNDETNKLIKEKKLLFVMFCGQFGLILLNRNVRINSLTINGQSYTLEPYH